jgi:hypothetical protein
LFHHVDCLLRPHTRLNNSKCHNSIKAIPTNLLFSALSLPQTTITSRVAPTISYFFIIKKIQPTELIAMTLQGFKRHARRVSTDENERPAHRRRLASLRNLQTFSQRRRLPPFRRQPGTTVRFGPATSEEDSWIAFRSSSAPESPPLIFPRYLDRGIYREILKAAIAAIDPDLADVPADYITPRLEVIGPECVL